MRRAAALLLLLLAPAAAPAALPVERAEPVRRLPHDPGAFTEGLFYRGGFLYESTGEPGQSSIRKVDLASGRVLQSVSIPPPIFGEGIVAWGNQIISLTWRHQIGWRWSLDGFRQLGSWRYPGEGWALTSDGKSLIMSDGSADLRFLDPVTLKERRRLQVTAEGQPVQRLNELEWVNGEILANIWMTDRIARIDPASGRVKGWIDLSALHAQVPSANPDAVANGIAWDAKGRRLFVTGKYWPVLFEIRPPHSPRRGSRR